MPKGESISDGAMLIKGSTDHVYLLNDIQKRHIADPNTMDTFGLNWKKIKILP
jgi:hypothetical protein